MSRISKLGRVLIAVGTVVLAGELDALSVEVQKARKAEIRNTEEIVTNVTFDLDLPYASIGNAGLVQPLSVNSTNQSGIVFGDQGTIYVNADPAYGLYRTVTGKLAVSPATWEDYEAGTSWYKPITPAILKDILAPFTVKSVKRNGTALTPDANGAVDISVPTKFNDVCPDTENWLGVPGTTAAGKSIKVLAKTVNGVIEGGMTVTGSSNNDNNTTKYRYSGVTATRNGTATDYLFDNSTFGIARFVDLSGYVQTNHTGNVRIKGSVAEGTSTASGNYSHAEGSNTTASGDYSHAEGHTTIASGNDSHAEGDFTKARGDYSHSEGNATAANGYASHAEGNETEASGYYSHAEGASTTATNNFEHAQGVFNLSHKASNYFGNPGNTLSSIGFGNIWTNRKNAVETMQDGKTFIYGLGGYDGTNPTNSVDLATSINNKSAVGHTHTWTEIGNKPTNVSSFNNDVNYIKLTELTQAVLAAVTNDIPVITDKGEGFTEEELVQSINELAGALNRLRAAALEP